MERLGGSRHAQSRRSRESETIRQDEEEAESQPRASAYTRLSYDEDDLDKIGSVARKLRALEEKVDEKAGAKKHTLAKSPFSARVHAQKLRRKVKLEVEKFTGKEDPNVHLDTFHNAAQMAGCTDAEECLLFFSSLRGRSGYATGNKKDPKANTWTRHQGKDLGRRKSGKDNNNPDKEFIQMIVGGLEGGDTASQRKNWAKSLHVAVVSLESHGKQARREPITFTDRDLPRTGGDHNDPLVITMDINGADVARVLVDTGSSVNVLYLDAFKKLKLDRSMLRPLQTPLSGFTGASIEAEGQITLPVTLGSGFTKYLEDFGITHNKASVAYPQGNGQVENANRTIVDGIKKRLGEAGTNWLEELPHIIWAYRVTSRRATGETPFVLTYGCEARLPIEAKIMTFREKIYVEKGNEEDHLAELNLLEERRMVAEAKMIEY
ncbi:unnamed protein product [Cuscuta campestris]|uniref:Integrase catalytic domain-containing protein n=1 Tax=Cuscuta campestris TaxID=132261 RepID=A0A484K5V0_9ASTE|nr:unnamed protein product [Cuscuta campestris]